MLLNFSKMFQNKFCDGECFSHYTLTNKVRVSEGKIIKKNDLKGIGIHFELAGGSNY